MKETIKETLQTIANQGYAECKLCGFKAYGSNFGEILEKLGEHWEKDHKAELS